MTTLPRRTLLKGLGATLALPVLECMSVTPPRRMLIIANNLGVLPKLFFPTTTGRNYQLSTYLEHLSNHRNDFTVFSGLSHPGVTGGHSTDNCFLTAARGAFKAGFRNQISLDQLAAEKLGQATRFPSLNLGVNIEKANRSLSWTRDGVLLPAEDSPAALYKMLFVKGNQQAVQQQLHKLEERGSILDTLQDQTGRLNHQLGATDKARLDQYMTSIRDVEQRLTAARQWELRPKPKTNQPPPTDIDDKKCVFDKFELMLSMVQLALESDSTRIITLMVDTFMTPIFKIDGEHTSTDGYHNLTHHSQAPEKVKQLEQADRQQLKILNTHLTNLADTKENGQRLLDQTMVLYGSSMGDANIHDNTNLPIILAGGGFKHGQHIAFKRDNNAPLSNLYLSMLHRLGIETNSFGTSTSTLTGLE
ncbi:MAG: DUF1552 domain-containing protein [Acidobacteria bacterium]|nr:DUF1552 domain-containing protein [Acidobacteriota bacterium]